MGMGAMSGATQAGGQTTGQQAPQAAPGGKGGMQAPQAAPGGKGNGQPQPMPGGKGGMPMPGGMGGMSGQIPSQYGGFGQPLTTSNNPYNTGMSPMMPQQGTPEGMAYARQQEMLQNNPNMYAPQSLPQQGGIRGAPNTSQEAYKQAMALTSFSGAPPSYEQWSARQQQGAMGFKEGMPPQQGGMGGKGAGQPMQPPPGGKGAGQPMQPPPGGKGAGQPMPGQKGQVDPRAMQQAPGGKGGQMDPHMMASLQAKQANQMAQQQPAHQAFSNQFNVQQGQRGSVPFSQPGTNGSPQAYGHNSKVGGFGFGNGATQVPQMQSPMVGRTPQPIQNSIMGSNLRNRR